MKEQIPEPPFTLSLKHKTTIITYEQHETQNYNHQTAGENHCANDPAVEGTGEYNKEQLMFHLAILCLWNRSKHSENGRQFKLFNLVIKYINIWDFFVDF